MTSLNANLLRGTLELLVLRSLQSGALHGYGILEWIERAVSPELLVEEGTLYPALHRLEAKGWIKATWGASENNRKAKYYSLTSKGARRVASESETWRAYASKVLGALEGGVEGST
jgi:transcriptional regulator